MGLPGLTPTQAPLESTTSALSPGLMASGPARIHAVNLPRAVNRLHRQSLAPLENCSGQTVPDHFCVFPLPRDRSMSSRWIEGFSESFRHVTHVRPRAKSHFFLH